MITIMMIMLKIKFYFYYLFISISVRGHLLGRHCGLLKHLQLGLALLLEILQKNLITLQLIMLLNRCLMIHKWRLLATFRLRR